jgi:NAD(P)-dependent dehydrogenase (short-subunit alcohol dehydrogenase family)
VSTPQAPFGSGFGAATTAAEILRDRDLSGKTAIVTGGYSGIGRETARVLRAAGADRSDGPARPGVDRRFRHGFVAAGTPLHILVNSAGIMACPLTRDARGYEAQFSTNHLGHFQLVARLMPALRRGNGARVASVSSWDHRRSPAVFDDPNFERRVYERWSAYGQSKTANILFALTLDKRSKGGGIRAFSPHPEPLSAPASRSTWRPRNCGRWATSGASPSSTPRAI